MQLPPWKTVSWTNCRIEKPSLKKIWSEFQPIREHDSTGDLLDIMRGVLKKHLASNTTNVFGKIVRWGYPRQFWTSNDSISRIWLAKQFKISEQVIVKARYYLCLGGSWYSVGCAFNGSEDYPIRHLTTHIWGVNSGNDPRSSNICKDWFSLTVLVPLSLSPPGPPLGACVEEIMVCHVIKYWNRALALSSHDENSSCWCGNHWEQEIKLLLFITCGKGKRKR